jgi:hypothetical protein
LIVSYHDNINEVLRIVDSVSVAESSGGRTHGGFHGKDIGHISVSMRSVPLTVVDIGANVINIRLTLMLVAGYCGYSNLRTWSWYC